MCFKKELRSNISNKAFKTDSQRSAFWVLLSSGVYGGKVKFGGRVAHYLTRR